MSHGDRLASLLASINSRLAAVSARIAELQVASFGAPHCPQDGGLDSVPAPVSDP